LNALRGSHENTIFSSDPSNEPNNTAIAGAIFDFSTATSNNLLVTLPLRETAVAEKLLAVMRHSLPICKYSLQAKTSPGIAISFAWLATTIGSMLSMVTMDMQPGRATLAHHQ